MGRFTTTRLPANRRSEGKLGFLSTVYFTYLAWALNEAFALLIDQNSLEVTDRHHNGTAIWWHTGFGWRPDAIHKPMKKILVG